MSVGMSGDWHSDNMRRTYLINGIPNREIDIDRVVKFMVNTCKKQKVKVICILGDLFEKHMIGGYYFSKMSVYLRAFVQAGISVIVTPGNHDFSESEGSTTMAIASLNDDGILVIDSIQICVIDNKKVLVIPHESRNLFKDFPTYTDYVKNKLKEFKKNGEDFDYVMGHFQPFGIIPGSEEEMFCGTTRILDTSIFGGKKVFCSHVHKPQEIDNVVVIGNIFRFNSDETKDKKRFIIWDGKNIMESIELPCQKMEVMTIDASKINKNTAGGWINAEKYRDSMVCVIVKTGTSKINVITKSSIQEALDPVNAKVISYKVVSEKKEKVAGEEKTHGSMSPEGVLKRVIKRTVKETEDRKRIYSIAIRDLEGIE